MALAITPEDFSNSTTDPLRSQWTVGKMRHVVAALGGAEVIVVTDRGTGHAVQGRLVAAFEGGPSRGARLTVETDLPEGKTTRTHYFMANVSTVIQLTLSPADIAMAGAKWRALESYRKESMAAIEVARARHPEWDYGAWKGTPCDGLVSVTYTSQKPGDRTFGHETVSLSELGAR
jgi:hypothetical protein